MVKSLKRKKLLFLYTYNIQKQMFYCTSLLNYKMFFKIPGTFSISYLGDLYVLRTEGKQVNNICKMSLFMINDCYIW